MEEGAKNMLEANFREDTPEIRETKERWMAEQLQLKEKLIITDDFTWDMDSNEEAKTFKYIGGVDISFIKDNNQDACASLIVMTFPDFKVVYSKFEMVKLTLPYISTFLAFREVPFLSKLIEDLRRTNPEVFPQLIMVDGNGFLHPRGFGLACHLGVLVDVPTIGIGKTFLMLDGITIQKEKALEKTLTKGGETVNLVGDSGTVWGALLRSTDDTSKPVFVSVGHRISLATALEVTKRCCLYRIPEPVRQADLMSRDFIRKNTP